MTEQRGVKGESEVGGTGKYQQEWQSNLRIQKPTWMFGTGVTSNRHALNSLLHETGSRFTMFLNAVVFTGDETLTHFPNSPNTLVPFPRYPPPRMRI